jgi:GT2 family glycosyltransferase
MKILAAIVTYNRMELLERCIDHVLGQTRAPDGLLVVNNSSSDGTVGMLQRKGVDFVTQPNVGSAGGWNRCIAEAVERGYDAVWLMDDDGYPGASALAILEAEFTSDVACISSVVLSEEDPKRFVFPFPVLDQQDLPVLFARKRKIPLLDDLRRHAGSDTYPFAHLFNGALVRTETVRQIGNVNADFFIFGDEVDYFMRMRRAGKVLSHLGAHHYHPAVSERPLNATKFYYYVKNTIILNNRYLPRQKLAWNLSIIAAALARTARRNSLREALSYVAGARAPLLWKAIARGRRARIGKDFDD